MCVRKSTLEKTMKITKARLKEMIKEEADALNESARDMEILATAIDSMAASRGPEVVAKMLREIADDLDKGIISINEAITVRDIERMLPSGVMAEYPGAANILQRRALAAKMSRDELVQKIKAAKIKDNSLFHVVLPMAMPV